MRFFGYRSQCPTGPERDGGSRRTLAPLTFLWSSIVLIGCMGNTHAAEHEMAAFVQAGAGDRPVWSTDIGLVRDFRSKDAETDSHWRFFGEFSLGKWKTRAIDGQPGQRYTHVGATPTFRYAFGAQRSVFVELGVGFNTITSRSGNASA